MKPFAIQKSAEQMQQDIKNGKFNKVSKLANAFFEAGRIVVIAGGILGTALIANEYSKNNENDSKKHNGNNVTSKKVTKANSKTDKTYMTWAKKHQDERL